jgi:hypothetical protein
MDKFITDILKYTAQLMAPQEGISSVSKYSKIYTAFVGEVSSNVK